MTKYKIISDSACDLDKTLLEKNDIDVVPFYVTFNEKDYLKEYVDININEFYEKLLNNSDITVKTSLPSVHDYIDKFTPYLKNGEDILCCCLNSNFSGSYQSALTASNILKEEFPNNKIIVIDTKQATGSQGLFVLQAVRLRDAGYSIEQSLEKLNEIIDYGFIIFVVDTLEYLQKGGRIGKVSAFAGTLLNIKPIIVLKDSELLPYTKARGRKKAISIVYETFIKNYKDKLDDYEFAITQSVSEEECIKLKELLKKEHSIECTNPFIDIGPTIGSHIGPNVLGISCIKKVNI